MILQKKVSEQDLNTILEAARLGSHFVRASAIQSCGGRKPGIKRKNGTGSPLIPK
ncbi:Uncharacterised protein [Chryseobacterium carnipullorum]|uniref:Uncharacterized protein n=1 Tax=Chryseobacterium carnipullorum TaxID=1124835 RepID=A0A376E5E9_CHRCU|nr:Uncharacterised protein [Chryseobacterium carnipullorum]